MEWLIFATISFTLSVGKCQNYAPSGATTFAPVATTQRCGDDEFYHQIAVNWATAENQGAAQVEANLGLLSSSAVNNTYLSALYLGSIVNDHLIALTKGIQLDPADCVAANQNATTAISLAIAEISSGAPVPSDPNAAAQQTIVKNLGIGLNAAVQSSACENYSSPGYWLSLTLTAGKNIVALNAAVNANNAANCLKAGNGVAQSFVDLMASVGGYQSAGTFVSSRKQQKMSVQLQSFAPS